MAPRKFRAHRVEQAQITYSWPNYANKKLFGKCGFTVESSWTKKQARIAFRDQRKNRRLTEQSYSVLSDEELPNFERVWTKWKKTQII
ncbi:hypothetical protein TNCT_598711 [Trichonephila clavata]|uniref:Uncharacterized protein n=1 Tax=Trichonephila clavata TaxID=2740835 RepID=A0A8X6L065_TRICU|nr:hypothetical protein TNCT_598711 [Trichonephila clavata]